MGFLYEMPNISAFREVDLKKRPCKMDIRGRKLKFCRKNGTSRITMGLVPFSLCGDMGYLSGLDINISELAGFLRGNGISSLS